MSSAQLTASANGDQFFQNYIQKMKTRHIVLALVIPPPILGFWGVLGTHYGCVIGIVLGFFVGIGSELEMKVHNDNYLLNYRSAGWALMGISVIALFWGAIATAAINYLCGAEDMFARMPLTSNIMFIIAVVGLILIWKSAEDAPSYSE